MLCPAWRLALPLFLDVNVFKGDNQALKTPWCRKWDQPASCTTQLFFFFYSCSTLLLFTHTTRYFTNSSTAAPRGGKELRTKREFMRLTNSLGETHATVRAAPTCWFLLLPACAPPNERRLFLCQVNNVPTSFFITSADRTAVLAAQMWCWMGKKNCEKHTHLTKLETPSEDDLMLAEPWNTVCSNLYRYSEKPLISLVLNITQQYVYKHYTLVCTTIKAKMRARHIHG